jgi:hypothetical protein
MRLLSARSSALARAMPPRDAALLSPDAVVSPAEPPSPSLERSL